MYLGFALDSSDIGLSDTDLDLLDTGINSKCFVGLQDVFQTSWRTIFGLPRHLSDVFKTSSRPTNVCW